MILGDKPLISEVVLSHDGSNGGNGDDDGDVGVVPPIERHRFSGTYL
jgi:hypothetical protein